MIAVPMKGNKEESSITTVFGKAKHIALIDENTKSVEFKEINFSSGRTLAAWLVDKGVTKAVVKDMGANPFMSLHNNGVQVYFCDEKRANVSEIVDALEKGAFNLVTPENFNTFFEGKSAHHGHGHEHGDHDHDHGCGGHGEGHGHGCETEGKKSGEKCCDSKPKESLVLLRGQGKRCCGRSL